MIVIIDYGMGNLASIQNILKKIGTEGTISSDVSKIKKADKLILPGVGAFDSGMENLQKMGLVPILNEKVLVRKTPILGICLGMQLFSKKSEEGQLQGLSWIDAETVKFRFDNQQISFKIPHMGWNTISIKKKNMLFKGLESEARFYFVHSYHVICKNEEDVLTETNYGCDFVSSLQKGNIFGVQFHPEKSHKFGTKLFKNFVEILC